MAVQPLLDPPLGKAFLHVSRRDSLPKLREEQGIIFGAKQAAQIEPVFYPRHGVTANGQAALFAALAHHPDFAGIQIEMFDIEVHQLGKT